MLMFMIMIMCMIIVHTSISSRSSLLQACIGRIIGRGGETIKRLEQEIYIYLYIYIYVCVCI